MKGVEPGSVAGPSLHVRPIRHRLEGRVRAHIFLSMLAYCVQWHMIQALAPLTFADEVGPDAARLADPVAPARRSKAALDKARTRTLTDCAPAMSFTRLLAHMASIVRSTVSPIGARAGAPWFTLTTRPNARQQAGVEPLASDDWLPPSKSTVSFLRRTAGRSKGSGASSVMAAAAWR